jgi:nucleoside-triphosphatase THEP1
VLGEEFIEAWTPRPEPGERLEGQHLEVTGQSGSGKSYVLKTIFQQRALKRNSGIIYISTKLDDPTVAALFEMGWPRAKTFDEVKKHRQCVFWPETKAIGEAKDKFFEERIYDLLSRIWTPESNTIVAHDEIGYSEDLSRRLKKLIRQYWREARALGISVVASKQRPVGVVRDQHSESRWKIVFPPADEGDMDRFAELLGQPRDWAPVLRSLDQDLHQFVLRNTVTKDTFISWIDFDADKLPKLPKREEHPMYPSRAA